jgi:DNA-directed RNA polymerase specialized sigma24 family protein
MPGESSGDPDASVSEGDEQAHDGGTSARPADAPACNAHPPASHGNEAASSSRARARDAHESARDAAASARRRGASGVEADEPASEGRGPASEGRLRTGDASGPTSLAITPTSLADDRARVTRTSVTPEDFRAFLVHADTRRWVLAIVHQKVPADEVEDLAQDALAEAARAFERAPPSKDDVLVVWIATITRRVVADYWRKRGRRRKYEGPMPRAPAAPSSAWDSESRFTGGEARPIAQPSRDPREGRVDQLDLEGTFLFRWLEGQVASHSLDRETFELVLEHGLREKTYQRIADERGIPLTVLSSRIFEFKKKYIPRYKRAKERAVLLIILFGVVIVALGVWLLSRTDKAPRGSLPPTTTPVLDRVLGNPLPVSHPRPADGISPDAGTVAPDPR